MTEYREIRHFHLFCGLGGGAAGFNRGQARLGALQARFRCLGGVDSDPQAIADFSQIAGVPGTVLDLFDRDQYRAFHGEEPPAHWHEATPEDIRKAAGSERLGEGMAEFAQIDPYSVQSVLGLMADFLHTTVSRDKPIVVDVVIQIARDPEHPAGRRITAIRETQAS